MSARSLHNFVRLPSGKTIGEFLPAFSDVKHEIHLGTPSKTCGSCRKPFSAVRKPRKKLYVYPMHIPVPIRFDVCICGACLALYRRGGTHQDGVLAAIEVFVEGEEVTQ